MRAGGTTALALAFALVAPLALGPSCASKDVDVHLLLPNDVAARTAWIELGAVAAACPDPRQLAGGLPADGSVQKIAYAYRPDDPNPPGLGSLKRGAYAFMATARANDCSVLAAGCTQVDLDQRQDVEIDLQRPAAPPAGACTPGTYCDKAQCLPTGRGTGCSLTLAGAGPLPDPMALGGSVLSAPSIVATGAGFLVVYRELDPYVLESRLTLLPLLDNGGRGPAQYLSLGGSCTNGDESDGVGLAWRDGSGLVVRTRPICGGDASLDYFIVDSNGIISKQTKGPLQGGRARLAQTHAVAPAPGQPGAFWVTYDADGSGRAIKVVNGVPDGKPISVGGDTPVRSSTIVSSEQMVALLATPGARTIKGDGGTSQPTEPTGPLRLQMVPTGSKLTGEPSVSLPGGWSALTAQGTRVFVVTEGTLTASPVRFYTCELDASSSAYESFGVPGSGAVLGADVAVGGDRAFFAVERAGGISLVIYDKATTSPVPFQTVFLPSFVRIPSAPTLRDGFVAVAASETRVAVAWTTGSRLARDDQVGGYAVFVCAP